MVLLEGDGLIEDLYYLLWQKDSPFYQRSGFKVNLPHTIIYKNKMPTAWYFTSRQGVIIRKKASNVVPEIIQHEFLKGGSKTGIVAYYIYRVKKLIAEEDQPQTIFKTREQEIKEKMSDEIFIRYFNAQQLVEFLKDENKPDSGVLQKFIDSYGEYNFVIQQVWSPVVCLFTKKVNLKKANETRYDMYERAMTFEGAEFYSKNVPLQGGMIPGKLRSITDKIVQHIANITYEKVIIHRMVVYFKVDPDENIWFLWCSSVRMKDLGGAKSARQFKIKTPISINSTVKVEQDIKLLRSNHIDHPAKLFTKETCIVCNKKVVKEELVEVKYKYLIKHEETQQRQGTQKNRRKGKIEIYDAFQEIDEVQGEKLYMKEERTVIPNVIRRIHPKMKVREYEAIKDTEAFLFTNASICEDCFLIISTNMFDETAGISPQRSKSSNVTLSPIRQPQSAQARYALRQIVLEKNKEYLEYTNQDEKNSKSLQLHSFLIQQNLKQYDEAMLRISKKNKVKPLNEILNPDVFYPSDSQALSQRNSSDGKQHHLTTSAPNSKQQSRSNMTSFRGSYPEQRSPGSHDDTGLEEFDSLRSELESIYRLKPRNMPKRKIVSADKFNELINEIDESNTERAYSHRPKRPYHENVSGNASSEYIGQRRSRSVQKGNGRVGKSLQFKVERRRGHDDDLDEIEDIDKMLNLSLPSNFEIGEEENEDHEEEEKYLDMHFPKEAETENIALKEDPKGPEEEKTIQKEVSKEKGDLEALINNEQVDKDLEKQNEPQEEGNSSLLLGIKKQPSKIDQMRVIYGVEQRPPNHTGQSKERLRTPLKPLSDKPKQLFPRNFNSSTAKASSTNRRSKSPIFLDPLPKESQNTARIENASSLVKKKPFK